MAIMLLLEVYYLALPITLKTSLYHLSADFRVSDA